MGPIIEEPSYEPLIILEAIVWGIIYGILLTYIFTAGSLYYYHITLQQYNFAKNIVETTNASTSVKDLAINSLNSTMQSYLSFPLNYLVKIPIFTNFYLFLATEFALLVIALILRKINNRNDNKIP